MPNWDINNPASGAATAEDGSLSTDASAASAETNGTDAATESIEALATAAAGADTVASANHDKQKLAAITATADTPAPANSKKPLDKLWNDFPFTPLDEGLTQQLATDFGLATAGTTSLPETAAAAAQSSIPGAGAFPFAFDPSRLFSRSEAAQSVGRRVYYVSPASAELLRTKENYRLKIVHSGLKVFEGASTSASHRMNANASASSSAAVNATSTGDTAASNHAYRLSQDAVAFLAPSMRRQLVNVTLADMLALLRDPQGLKTVDFSPEVKPLLLTVPAIAPGQALPAAAAAAAAAAAEAKAAEVIATTATLAQSLANDTARTPAAAAAAAATARAAAAVDVAAAASAACGGVALGSCVLRLPRAQLPAGVTAGDVLCAAWRTNVSVGLMVDAAEKASLLALLDPKEGDENGDGDDDNDGDKE